MAAIDVDGNFANGLGRVGMEEHAAFVAERADLVDGLQGADFVVRGQDRDQDWLLIIDCSPQIVESNATVGIHRQGPSRDSPASPATRRYRARPCVRWPA